MAGGIYSYKGTITKCMVFNNTAEMQQGDDKLSYGGGVLNGKGIVSNCTIFNNTADEYGGIGNSGLIINCTVYHNISSQGSGGISISAGKILNTISWNNEGSDIDGDISKVSWSCFGGADETNHNINLTPGFVNTNGEISAWDFHLQNGSPCIDMGNPWDAPEEDIEGNPRPGEDGEVCMGAYESPPQFRPDTTPEPVRLYVSKSGNNTDGSSWVNACISITLAVNMAYEKGVNEIWVAEGIYKEGEAITVPAGVLLYGGFQGGEKSLSERDCEVHKTIIDGESAYRCINNYGVAGGFTIRNGSSEENGGGVYNSGDLKNCLVFNNYANSKGGGIYNDIDGSVNSCNIFKNDCGYAGAGIYNNEGVVTQCSIFNNGDYTIDGGGIYNLRGIISTCLVYDNTAECGGGIENYEDVYGEGIVKYCRVYNNHAKYGGGIQNARGKILNCLIYNNFAENRAGCRNSGKIINCTVCLNIATSSDGIGGIANGGSVINSISWNNTGRDIRYDGESIISHSCFGEAFAGNQNIQADPQFINVSGDPSTWDFRLQNGSPCIDRGDPEEAPDTDIEGTPRPGNDGKVCMGAYESPSEYEPSALTVPRRLYVSKDGITSGGLTWETAFHSLKNALDHAAENIVYEIWVKEGRYKEGEEIVIPVNAAIYGGFAGTEENLFERDFDNYESIIDGESEHRCVKNYGIIDGFSVTGGNTKEGRGGGIYNIGGMVNNCYVNGNTSKYGGGNYNISGNIWNSYISNNTSESDGGGIYNREGKIYNCIVDNNTAHGRGGGIMNSYGEVEKCIVRNNRSDSDGGGIANCAKEVIDCSVYDNVAGRYGGGIYNVSSRVSNTECFNNTAEVYGGGIFTNYSKAEIINCTLFDNTAYYEGGGLYIGEFTSDNITNSIFWNNSPSDVVGDASGVSYSCFKEARGDNHNINSDPLFINVSGDASTWDLRLQEGSPCIDAGTTGEAPEKDINDVLRPQGMGCDMGVYERPFSDSARFISQNIPEIISANRDYNVEINMKNIGSSVWSSEDGYRLGDAASPDSAWTITRVELPNGQTVSPDESTSFTFTITAPSDPGIYDFQWSMIREPGENWFGEKSPLKEIRVLDYIPGDVDHDGGLTPADIAILRNYIFSKTILTPFQTIRSDANEDGEINAADIINILSRIE